MMRLLSLVTLFCFIQSVAVADVVSQTALELRLQEKIGAVVRPVDANAIILTSISFRKVDLNLPGMGASLHDVYGTNRNDQLILEDIDSIKIRVISSLAPFPPSLKPLIESSIGVDHKKIKFTFEKMDESLQKIIETRTASDSRIWAEPLINQFLSLINSSRRTLLYFLICFCGIYVLMSSLTLYFSSKQSKGMKLFWESTMDRLSQGFGHQQERVATPLPVSGREQTTETISSSSMHSREQLQELSTAAVQAVISDCYWCEKDDYAAWIWTSLSATQREDVIKSWAPALEYSSFLNKVSPEIQSHHLNSCYLRPLDLSLVSQADLSEWIRKNPASWSLISPLRQSSLKLSLQEKMTVASYQGPSAVPILPQASSQKRFVGKAVEVGELSEMDEIGLMQNPDVVPLQLRSEVWTLVWLAILPAEQMLELIEELSAQNLAEAWIAAPVILEKIETALPEKKRKLLHGYLKVIKPSRRSVAMKFLTVRALELAEENRKLKDVDAKAV